MELQLIALTVTAFCLFFGLIFASFTFLIDLHVKPLKDDIKNLKKEIKDLTEEIRKLKKS